jgi:hypothetical protein
VCCDGFIEAPNGTCISKSKITCTNALSLSLLTMQTINIGTFRPLSVNHSSFFHLLNCEKPPCQVRPKLGTPPLKLCVTCDQSD